MASLFEVILTLSKKYDCKFTSERELRCLRAQDGIGQRKHIPDSELLLHDKKIAVEVELSTKGNRRLQKTMNEYMKNFDIHEVWYFCWNNEIKRQVMKYQLSHSFLKVFDLDEGLFLFYKHRMLHAHRTWFHMRELCVKLVNKSR